MEVEMSELVKFTQRTFFGFRKKGVQLPLLMIWTEYYDDDGSVVFAYCHFNSRAVFGV